ncbi:1I prespore protein [Dictyostelium discoideum AX4]|uniref:Prespore-specific protein E n=1 Tax=Dictyostelium discoideum TaxID=44689 RepID=PSPE_DICDI|nr:1I prespore protein [Dictyostelium discoideum AX4]Q9GP84.1 RecName: Full=Prespore-specific protein E; AltName: Full=Protein 1I; Flags: Precursor [Dictyostelium discoideum]EAL63950.1 1I prespore protein [Dictyostelium discoideum AX4]CAC21551.1 1I protein [Dictyostelium discoideum]|eukprot:XP_637462.1 1I prespore protein [Dictyostelium discoideum AX4]
MRFISIFLIIVALCVSSSWAFNFTDQPNSFRISGTGCGSGTTTVYFSTDGRCNSACGGSIRIKGEGNNVPNQQFTLNDYSKNVTNCSGTSNVASFRCPALVNTTSPTFTVNVGNSAYHVTCQYAQVTETPAGNSADKVAVGIAIIFGALISLLAL